MLDYYLPACTIVFLHWFTSLVWVQWCTSGRSSIRRLVSSIHSICSCMTHYHLHSHIAFFKALSTLSNIPRGIYFVVSSLLFFCNNCSTCFVQNIKSKYMYFILYIWIHIFPRTVVSSYEPIIELNANSWSPSWNMFIWRVFCEHLQLHTLCRLIRSFLAAWTLPLIYTEGAILAPRWSNNTFLFSSLDYLTLCEIHFLLHRPFVQHIR